MSKLFYSGISSEDIKKEALPGESWEEAGHRIALQRARQKAESSSSQAQPAKNAQPQNTSVSASVIHLPKWPESQRGAPNEVVRSALFNARNRRQKRVYLSNAEIYVIGEGSITYTGEELRQDDETVWLHLIHLARKVPIGELIEFSPRQFCLAIGWADTGQSYQRLRDCLTRLQATALGVHSRRLREGFSLSMIPYFRWKDAQGHALKLYQVRIAPELIEFFGGVYYTQIEWEQRLALSNGLATWLHGYFASHKEPFPIKLETIRDAGGLTTERMDHLREQVEIALESLKEVGFIVSWKIEKNLVHVTRA